MFWKPLLLPSNGITYSKIIEIKEPTVSFLLALKRGWLSSSENELIYCLIREYTSFKNPEKILYKDSQFLYFYFLSLLNSKSIIDVQNTCNYCNYKSTIEVDLANLNIKYAKESDLKNKKYCFGDFVFNFRNRILSDSIESGIKNLQFKQKTVETISNFIEPQFLNGTYKDEEFKSYEIYEILQEIGITQAMEIFDLLQFEDWGLPNQIEHYCTKCKRKNKLTISDPLMSSMYTSPNNDKTKELLDTAVSIAGSKTISYSDFLNSPITNIDSLMQSIQDFLKKKYGKGKSDYLDDFQEELE